MGSTVWGIHGGRGGAAHSLFIDKGCIAIGWNSVGDMSKLAASRDAFKERIAEVSPPDRKPPSIATSAGQAFRFVHGMKTGDYVVYPSKADRQIHIGKIAGGYQYDPGDAKGFPHRRRVDWLRSFPRTRFSQGALYEVGSALTLFLVKSYTDEFLAALEGKEAPARAEEPESAEPLVEAADGIVAERIEGATRDFVLKQIARELKGHPFAELVADLLRAMGYRCRISPPGPDGGIDIIAHKDELGFVPPLVKVQVKSSESSVGDPAVSALFGKLTGDEYGLIVSLGTFTPQAVRFAQTKSKLRLIDGDELVDLILAHYEQLEARFKGLLPLKRVYVPEPLDENEE